MIHLWEYLDVSFGTEFEQMRRLSRLAVNGYELSHYTKQETVNANCDNSATVFKQFNQRLEYLM